MSGPVPKKKKIPPKLTPEQVAARESMKKGLGKSGFNPYPYKKTETPNHNTSGKVATKNKIPEPLFILDIKTMRQKPVSIAFIENLANKLINWVNASKEIIIDDFLQQEGYSHSNFKVLRDKSDKLEEAYQYAKMCIGNKRERDAYYNKGNAALIMKSLPDYSPRWKKLTKWHAEINTQNQNINQGIQVVEIPAAEKTSIVPPLKKDKDAN